jgi:hypothetical protein
MMPTFPYHVISRKRKRLRNSIPFTMKKQDASDSLEMTKHGL